MSHRGAIAVVVVALVACGNLEGAPPSTSDPGDAGADATTPDAQAQAPLPGSFCDQHKDAYFCEDFDRGTLAAFSAESREVGNGTAAVNVEAGAGVGGTPGMHLVLTSTSNPNQNVIFTRDLVADAPDARSYRLELDVRFTKHDVRYGVIAGFRVFDFQTPVVKGVGTLNPDTFDLFGANPRKTQLMSTITGTWHHVVFAMEKGAATHDLGMSVDGAAKLTATANLGGTKDLSLLIGNYWGSGLVSVDYVVDNVVVYVR